MNFVHECNKNNRKDTKRDESASVYLLMLTNWLKGTRIFRAQKVRRIGRTLRYGNRLNNQIICIGIFANTNEIKFKNTYTMFETTTERLIN